MADAPFLCFFFFLLACALVTRSDAGGCPLPLCSSDPWRICCRVEDGRRFSNKIDCRIIHSADQELSFADRKLERCCLPLADRGGEERKMCYCSTSGSVEWVWSWCVLAFERGVGRRLRHIFSKLPWWKQMQELFKVSSAFKRCCLFFGRGVRWLHLLLAGRGGEGCKSSCFASFASVGRLLLHPRASHAVAKFAAAISGQEGGRSSTSSLEASSSRSQC